MRHLSPHELAAALGVSESSLKRWADAGKIAVTRTQGGHRRIRVSDAMKFIRQSGLPVVRPELLGFPEAAPAAGVPTGDALFAALRDGDARAVRGLIVGGYLAGTPVAALGDGPIRDALHRLGELWRHREDGVFVEHRATDLCVQALAQLRATLDPPTSSWSAVGGGPTGDPYLLPTFLAATVLAAEGIHAINLGPETPAAAFTQAIAAHAPRLVWISVTSPIAPEVVAELDALIAREAAAGRTIVIGGREHERLAPPAGRVHAAGSMAALLAIARELPDA